MKAINSNEASRESVTKTAQAKTIKMMGNMSLNRNKSSFDAKMHKKIGSESLEFLTASKFEHGKRVNLNIGERRLSNSSASSSVYSDE